MFTPNNWRICFAPLTALIVLFASIAALSHGARQVYPVHAVESSMASRRSATGAIALDLSTAATQNAALKDNLEWTFGGKQQRGWHIYLPLIAHLIETDRDAETTEFAAALARWQKSAGLAPSGVLDQTTLMQMIQSWQSRRSTDRSYPTPDQLLTAPATEFFDATRDAELRQVEKQTYAAYKRLIAAAAQDPALKLSTRNGELSAGEKFLKIISAFRSKEYQDRLREKSPTSGRAGLAVNSPHFTGRALDLYVGGQPVETKDANRALQTQTPVYKWLVKNAARFGFVPYFYEPWHWEYRAN